MRTIVHDGKAIALVFDGTFEEGSNPQTDPSLPLQVMTLRYPKGKKWPRHFHEAKPRTAERGAEFHLVMEGSARLSLYVGTTLIEEIILGPGQGALTLDAAHSMEALEEVQILEFKNGPYIEDKVLVDESPR